MARKTLPREPEEKASLPEVVNLSNAQVDSVDAELVRVNRSTVGSIAANEVELHQSGAGQMTAQAIAAHGSWIGAAQAGSFTMNNGGVVAVRAQEAALNGRAGVITTQNATLAEGSQVGVLATTTVRAEKVRTVVLLARQVEGPVETVLDTRRVLLASAVAGIAAGVVVLLGQFLFGRKE